MEVPLANQPQLVYVDPLLIKFNRNNPRKHAGIEFEQLSKSISEVGFVQLPSVRVMPGGFYEVIDGEGRVLSAQAQKLNGIWAVNFGIVSDAEALEMLMSANVVRTFGLIAECRGMAEMHRQGESFRTIAAKVGLHPSTVQDRTDVGYFPAEFLVRIETDIAKSSEKARMWGMSFLREMTSLRQIVGDQDPSHSQTLDGVYDYSEVEKAIEKVLRGEISTTAEMQAYVANRRLEMFQERVDKELQARLQAEMEIAKATLAESYRQELQQVQESTAKEYNQQVETLQSQVKSLSQRYNALVADAAKRPEALERRQAELDEEIKKTKEQREKLRRLEEEARAQTQRAIAEAQSKISAEVTARLQEQRVKLEEEYKKARQDLEAFYTRKDQERQLAAEKSVRGSVARGIELLAQIEQWMLHITSRSMLPGLNWLSKEEKIALLAQLTTVRNTLSEAIEAIGYGDSAPLTVEVK